MLCKLNPSMKSIHNLGSKYLKEILVFFAVLFLLLGWHLGNRTEHSINVTLPNGAFMTVHEGETIAQRVIGSDNKLKAIKLYIESYELSDNALIKISLIKGDYKTDNADIVATREYGIDDLQTEKELYINFKNEKLLYNRDYYIVIQFRDLQDSYITFCANDEEYGLCGEKLWSDGALANEMIYEVYTGRGFFVWKIIFLFAGISFAFCAFFKKNFFEGIGVVCISIAILLYMFAILEVLWMGCWLILMMALISYGYLGYKLWKVPGERVYSFVKDDILFGCFAWIGLILLCLRIDSLRVLFGWDDLGHWAHYVESMYQFDRLPIHSKSTVTLFRYPPLFPTYQYFFQKIYGRFSTEGIYFAKHFFDFSLIMGCLGGCKKNRWGILPLVFICGIGLQDIFFEAYQVNSNYMDITLGITLGFALIRLFHLTEYFDRYNYIILLLGIVALTLTKETGLFLSFMVIASVICVWFWYKREFEKINWKKIVVSMTGVAIVSITTWQIYLKSALERLQQSIQEIGVSEMVSATTATEMIDKGSTAVNTAAASGISLEKLFHFMIGKGEDYQYEIILPHIKKVFLEREFLNAVFPLSYFGWVFVLCIVIWMATRKLKRYERRGKISIVILVVLSVFMVLFMHVAYTFTFNMEEARSFASEARYLGTVLMGGGLLALEIYLLCQEEREKKYLTTSLLICAIILILSGGCYNYRKAFTCEGPVTYGFYAEDSIKYEKEATTLKKEACIGEDEKLLYLADDNGLYQGLTYQYYMTPTKVEVMADVPKDMIYEELYDTFKAFDYIYVERAEQLYKISYDGSVVIMDEMYID